VQIYASGSNGAASVVANFKLMAAHALLAPNSPT
jgi:hypothetical protein